MTEAQMWGYAGECFEMAGDLAEAARCYRRSGADRKAGDLYARIGRHDVAALAYAAAGDVPEAAWQLAHHAQDPAAARALLAGYPDELDPTSRRALLYRLVNARCAAAESDHASVLAVLAEVQLALAETETTVDRRVEPWAVLVAEAVRRFDQVALTFAAAVRGHRALAAQRWSAWAERRLGTRIVIPAPATPAPARS